MKKRCGIPSWVTGRVMSVVFLTSLILGLFTAPSSVHAFFFTPALVYTQLGASAAQSAGLPVGNAGKAASDVAKTTNNDIVRPAFRLVVREVLINLLSFVSNRLAYDLAVSIASAGTGQTSLFDPRTAEEAWKDFGLDVAGEAIQSLNDVVNQSLEADYNFCSPQGVNSQVIRLGLQLGIKNAYSRPQPRCEFQNFAQGLQANLASLQGLDDPTARALELFSQAYDPGQSELAAAIQLNVGVHTKVLTKKAILTEAHIENSGFKNVVNVITGQVETPAVLLRKQTESLIDQQRKTGEQQLNLATEDKEVFEQFGLSVASVFFNTLISGLANRLYSGLFNPSPVPDPFNPDIAVLGGRERAEEEYRSILSAPIISLENFNIINEYATCPGLDQRSQFNCVMDRSFSEAVSRAETEEPLTVKQALLEGLLHGDWPMIPSSNFAKNQDPNCYGTAYCYGNLVKMRKARVLPVGWEMAANSPWNDQSDPVTLQEVVDGFHACNSQGMADEAFPWCHLIDPNWVIKFPETQCRALVPGELPVSSLTNSRQSVCVDTPSCVKEDDFGNCVGDYGYCTREENVWRFRGDACPAEFASCLSFNNVRTGTATNLLLNTIDQEGCTADNAGCRWYRTNRFLDEHGTTDPSDDTYEFLPDGDVFTTALRDDDVKTTTTLAPTYPYDSGSYALYAYEDRLYLNQNAVQCTADAAGCTEVIPGEGVTLNMIQNPSFEDDEDNDDLPDAWGHVFTFPDGYYQDIDEALHGVAAVTAANGQVTVFQNDIALQPNRFYTFSFSAKMDSASTPGVVLVALSPADPTDPTVNMQGVTVLGDCPEVTVATNRVATPVDVGEDYERLSCTFTTPSYETLASVTISHLPNQLTYYDAFQLEVGSTVSAFQEGYGARAATPEYLQLPPSWLGCTGAATDPDVCDDYTQMCTAQDVGCELYTPTVGGLSVPAITSALDVCPSECLGYATYKQEATLYEQEIFPLNFIASTADSCAAEEVGCDEFTNIDALPAGGEGLEYYTALRLCEKPEVNTGSTYYTWEGSDDSGYQLRTWQLLPSNLGGLPSVVYEEDSAVVFTETEPGLAPCTNSLLTPSGVVCADETRGPIETDTFTACNEHGDIFDDPDCREFYDELGNIHYRLFSQTVTIDAACTAYRKTSIVSPTGVDVVSVNTATGELVSAANAVDDGLDIAQSSCLLGGGMWTDAGACRYLVLPSLSNACAASAAGCRAYTGSTSRNASTIFFDTVEDGTLDEYVSVNPQVSISSNSTSAGGHSIRVESGELNILSLVEGDASVDVAIGDAAPTAGGQCPEGATCTLSDAGGSSCTVFGTEDDDVDDCGPLVGNLVQGKTYLVEFWALGVGELRAGLVDDRGNGSLHVADDPTVTLSANWELYTVGPFDTSVASAYADFDDTAVLTFELVSGTEFYIDNIQLKETEQNIPLIKNSWVTPSTCDQTPAGAPAPGWFLGCQEYEDRAGDAFNYHQFTSLCSEEVVGCQAYFDTQNSEALFGQVFNATCTTTSSVRPFACDMNGSYVCTIGVGKDTCLFDYPGMLPSPLPVNIQLGPEAHVVTNDTDIFLVNNGSTSCAVTQTGCMEVGVPQFSQDKSNVAAFAPAFYIADPEVLEGTLCSHEALFCEAWNSTADGTFYFKDPLDQACEYKTNVTIDNQSYRGWFRKDQSNVPCYYEDLNTNGAFDAETELDDAYLVSGVEFGIWRNGDEDFAGWAGLCTDENDRCSEFIDPLDTSEGQYPDGTPYNYLKNEKIDESSLSPADRCNGQVSLEEGCALFFDSVQPEVLYNASASYTVSRHADVFFTDAPRSLQSPVTCEGALDGPDAQLAQVNTLDQDTGPGQVLTQGGEILNVCRQRCRYRTGAGLTVPHPYRETVLGSETLVDEFGDEFQEFFNDHYTGSCLDEFDCPVLRDSSNNAVAGECVQNYEDQPTAHVPATYDPDAPSLSFDDVNDIRKVHRDRQCSEWLACSASYQVWDERTGRFREVCSYVDAYVGPTSVVGHDAEQLSLETYATRDVSWYGNDYSGYSIPGSIPPDFLTQERIWPDKYCTSNIYQPCSGDADCGTGTCEEVPEEMTQDYRLVFNAGACSVDDPNDNSCQVGHCEFTGLPCNTDSACGDGESCAFGYCKAVDLTAPTCVFDSDCAAYAPFDTCLYGQCTDLTTDACLTNADCGTGTPTVSYECQQRPTSFVGSCYNETCLLGTDGEPFDVDDSEEIECRGYPEQGAPYSGDDVQFDASASWVVPGTDETCTPDVAPSSWGDEDDQNENGVFDGVECVLKSRKVGYQSVDVCAPNSPDCQCIYQKVGYGNGIKYRYYEDDATEAFDVLRGVCFGGALEGAACEVDRDCNPAGTSSSPSLSVGQCLRRTSVERMIGLTGYCLERDTSINLFGNQQGPGACLTWLPVDQLASGGDNYNNFTSAGALLQDNAFMCTDVGLFADLFVTGSTHPGQANNEIANGCAESKRPGNGDSCDPNEFDGCWTNVACPKGYFGIVGRCDIGTESSPNPALPHNANNNCVTGGDDETGTDDDCPYFCVPYGAADYRPEVDTSFPGTPFTCEPPVTVPNYVKTVNAEGPETWTTDVYRLTTGSFVDAIDDYRFCARRGVQIFDDDPSNNQYARLLPYARGGGSTGYWQTNSDAYYLGCTEVAQVSSITENPRNKVWTDRVWGAGDPESHPYALNLAELGLAYTSLIAPTPHGRVEDDLLRAGSASDWEINGIEDGRPVMVASCLIDGETYAVAGTEACEAQPPYGPANPKEAHGYETFAALVPSLTEGEECSGANDTDSCNDGAECLPGPSEAGCFKICTSTGAAAPAPHPDGCWYDPDENGTAGNSLGDCVSLEDHSPNYDGAGPDMICELPTSVGGCGEDDTDIGNPPDSSPDTIGRFEKRICSGGNYDGNLCGTVWACRDARCAPATVGTWMCSYTGDIIGWPDGSATGSSSQSDQEAAEPLKEIFAKVIAFFGFDQGPEAPNAVLDVSNVPVPGAGTYTDAGYPTYDVAEDPGSYEFNVYGIAGDAPVVRSFAEGNCFPAGCREGEDGTFSVNGNASGTILGVNGLAHANIEFFTMANKNQMPIKNVIVNFGDSFQVGSTGNENFFKNHRGIENSSTTDSYCDRGDYWGETPASCDPNPFFFSHDYTCNDARIAQILGQPSGGVCEDGIPDPEGCVDSLDRCHYTPRVHVKDNWGWCTGECGLETGPGGLGCYDNENGGSPYNQNECDFTCDPNNLSACYASQNQNAVVDPWLYWSGEVVVEPFGG